MKLYYENTNVSLYQGDMLKVLDTFEEDSIDCIVTDPPYELNFMNKGWDNTGIVFNVETWKKCLRVLKPGGYLLCFGASRIFHRVFCAIEDAGFEIRDTIMWLYGSGFPKSMNIGKAIEGKLTIRSANVKDIKQLDGEKTRVTCGFNKAGKETEYRDKEYELVKPEVNYHTDLGKQWSSWGTALKPAYEPIMVARKPFDGSLVDNVLANGVGGFNIDECRVGTDVIAGGTMPDFRDIGQKSKEVIGIDKLSFGQVENAKRKPLDDHIGRFPSNLILTYDDNSKEEVCGGMPYTKSTGGSGEASIKSGLSGRIYNGGWSHEKAGSNIGGLGDEGSAARYFKNCEYDDNDLEDARRYYYCPKASKKDRDEGLDQFETKKTGELQGGRQEGSAGSIMLNADGTTRVNPYAGGGTPKKNIHPTVKPTSLMQYLVRLVAPKNAIILDPFNGSGSTGKACMLENRERDTNYKYIGIDLSEEYLNISKARIEWALGGDISIILNNGDQPDAVTDAATPVIKKNKLW